MGYVFSSWLEISVDNLSVPVLLLKHGQVNTSVDGQGLFGMSLRNLGYYFVVVHLYKLSA